MAGFDDDGTTPLLYQVDPSGVSLGWNATAIGKNYVNSKSFLEKRVGPDILLEDAIHTALLTLREAFEGEVSEEDWVEAPLDHGLCFARFLTIRKRQVTAENVELGIAQGGKFRLLTAEEVEDYLNEAN